HATNGEYGAVGRMRMHDGVHIRSLFEDIAMEAPFGGGLVPTRRAPIHGEKHDIVRAQFFVGNAAGGDEQTIAMAHADVAGRALVEAAGVHLQAMIDDGLATLALLHDVSNPGWSWGDCYVMPG